MTAIVGIICSDGLVIGTDSSVTFSAGNIRTIEQPFEKLTIVADRVIVAGTGQAGLGQRFCHLVQKAHDGKAFMGHHIDVGKVLCKMGVEDFGFTGASKGQYGALVGFPLGDKPHLCEFALADFQPEFKDDKMWYCSLGSGQLITDPFLAFIRHVFWSDGPPNVQDGVFAATWALEFAVQVNPGGVNGPVRIAVMERDKGRFVSRILDHRELDEHRQNIEEAKTRLRSLPGTQRADAPGTQDLPKPPT